MDPLLPFLARERMQQVREQADGIRWGRRRRRTRSIRFGRKQG